MIQLRSLRVINARAFMAAFLHAWLHLSREVNRHFLESEYGDLSFFFFCLELSHNFRSVK